MEVLAYFIVLAIALGIGYVWGSVKTGELPLPEIQGVQYKNELINGRPVLTVLFDTGQTFTAAEETLRMLTADSDTETTDAVANQGIGFVDFNEDEE